MCIHIHSNLCNSNSKLCVCVCVLPIRTPLLEKGKGCSCLKHAHTALRTHETEIDRGFIWVWILKADRTVCSLCVCDAVSMRAYSGRALLMMLWTCLYTSSLDRQLHWVWLATLMVTGLVPWVIGTVISNSCKKTEREKSQRETRWINANNSEAHCEDWPCSFCVFVKVSSIRANCCSGSYK